jgi:hypothetical protein
MPKGPKGEKRPRDLNQWAKRITDIVSGEVEDREPGVSTYRVALTDRRLALPRLAVDPQLGEAISAILGGG